MYKVKKIIICATLLIVTMTGCAGEVSRTAIDVRYTSAHNEVISSMTSRYDFNLEQWIYYPEIKTIYEPDKWEVLYKITYDNGKTYNRWKSVSQELYESVKRELFQEEYE